MWNKILIELSSFVLNWEKNICQLNPREMVQMLSFTKVTVSHVNVSINYINVHLVCPTFEYYTNFTYF